MKDYQQRVVDEKIELDKKANALSQFIGADPRFDDIDPIDQELMKEQCEAMWLYSEILGKRIFRFK